VTPDDVRVVEPGEEVLVAPLRVRLDRAEAAYEVSGRLAEPGRAFLVIEGTLSLEGHESVQSGVVADAFSTDLTSYEFDELTDDAAPDVQVAEDGSSLVGLGPDLTYRVLLVYEVDQSAVPASVTVSLLRHVRRPSSFDVSDIGWRYPELSARLELAVGPLPDERPAEEVL